MKTFLARLAIRVLISVAGCLLLTAVFTDDTNGTNSRKPHFYSKNPWAVGFGMEGTLTNVALIDERIQFQLNGRFWFAQYPPESTKQQVIEVYRNDAARAPRKAALHSKI